MSVCTRATASNLVKNSSETGVPATVGFVAATSQVKVNLDAFSVPLQLGGETVATVDVAKLFSIGVPLQPQVLAVPLPAGGTRSLNFRPISIATQYQTGKIVLTIDVAF